MGWPIHQNAIPDLSRLGKRLPDMFENVIFSNFSDQLVPTQKYPTETNFFDFPVASLRGVDPSKKKQDVRTIHFHPFSRRELRHVSENEGFRC